MTARIEEESKAVRRLKMTAEEMKQQKARNLRYKKPLMRDMSLDAIRSNIWEMQDTINDVQWFVQDETNLVNALDGDEDEAWAFKFAFSDLAAELEQFESDLQECWVPECFDELFPAACRPDEFGGMVGFDTYESDYFRLDSWEAELGQAEAGKRISRMTKKELLEAVGQCLHIYASYTALHYRYDCLEASLDIIRGQNLEHLKLIKAIEEQYETAEKESDGFRYKYHKSVEMLDRMLKQVPQEYWIQ